MGRSFAELGAVLLVAGCGRVGYELSAMDQERHDELPVSGGGGARALPDAASPSSSGGREAAAGGGASAGGQPGAGGGSSGGQTATGGNAAGGGSGAGGASAGGQAGAGGQLASGAQSATGDAGLTDAGRDGQVGAGGQPGGDGGYVCTPGAAERCDGRDDDCDTSIDEDGACSSQCTGREWGGHGYMLCDSNQNWNEAAATCDAEGLRLVRIDSQEENDFLVSFAFTSRRSDVWIGGSDLAEGDWRWPDGTSFWSGGASPAGGPVGGAYSHWYVPTEPDNLNAGTGEGDCLSFVETQGGAWVDQGCNYFARALCETP